MHVSVVQFIAGAVAVLTGWAALAGLVILAVAGIRSFSRRFYRPRAHRP